MIIVLMRVRSDVISDVIHCCWDRCGHVRWCWCCAGAWR